MDDFQTFVFWIFKNVFAQMLFIYMKIYIYIYLFSIKIQKI